MINVKRVYDAPSKGDGYRVLVDRLWPRGLTKDRAKVDLWIRDIAPSGDLRRWFSHDPDKWEEFQKRYQKELEGKKDLLNEIKRMEKGIVSILFSAKDEEHNNAVALRAILKKT